MYPAAAEDLGPRPSEHSTIPRRIGAAISDAPADPPRI